MILFVTGTGTGVGKTVVTVALTELLVSIGLSVAAIKPLETGCEPDALDAIALAAACKRPELSTQPGFYRARAPLSPYAATLGGEPPPKLESIVEACRTVAATGSNPLIVEGAGGLLVPLSATHSMADLALALGSKLVLVAPDRLGVLSDVLATVECAAHRNLPIGAIVLNRGTAPHDVSRAHNAEILRQRCSAPVVIFESLCVPGHGPVGPAALAQALGLAP